MYVSCRQSFSTGQFTARLNWLQRKFFDNRVNRESRQWVLYDSDKEGKCNRNRVIRGAIKEPAVWTNYRWSQLWKHKWSNVTRFGTYIDNWSVYSLNLLLNTKQCSHSSCKSESYQVVHIKLAVGLLPDCILQGIVGPKTYNANLHEKRKHEYELYTWCFWLLPLQRNYISCTE